MEEQKNWKNIICYSGAAFLVVSGAMEYIYYGSKRILTFEVKGFAITFLLMVLLIYSLKVKNKFLNLISYILIFVSYGYTLYTVLPLILSDDFKKSGISIGVGFYLHIVSLIIIFISIFIRDKSIVKKDDNTPLQIEGLDDKHFVIGKMVLGYKEIAYGKLSVMKNDMENNMVVINYEDENKNYLKKEIPYSSISDINYESSLTMQQSQSKSKEADYEGANLLLSMAMFGPGIGQVIANDTLNSFVYSYTKNSFKALYKIKIKCNVDGEDKTVMLETTKKPEEFVQNIKSKIQ